MLAIGVQTPVLGSYRAPSERSAPSLPPHTIISLSVHTAAPWARPGKTQPDAGSGSQVSEAGSYTPPSDK